MTGQMCLRAWVMPYALIMYEHTRRKGEVNTQKKTSNLLSLKSYLLSNNFPSRASSIHIHFFFVIFTVVLNDF